MVLGISLGQASVDGGLCARRGVGFRGVVNFSSASSASRQEALRIAVDIKARFFSNYSIAR